MPTETLTSKTDKTKIFWSRAVKLQIANFVTEKKDMMGKVMRPEKSIGFTEHIKVTDNLDEIKYIRKSNAFENGDCRECENMEEAQRLTIQHNRLKGIKDFRVDAVESTFIGETGQETTTVKDDIR